MPVSDVRTPTRADVIEFLQDGEGAELRNVGEKLREYVTVKDFGAKFDFNGVTGSDDSEAWAEAIEWAKTNYPKTLHVNDGFSLCNSVWPVIDKPVSIKGNGRSYVCFAPSATGKCVVVRNTGFNDESGYMPRGGNTVFTNSAEVIAGTELEGFWLIGNRTAAAKQHGLVFEGNCDFSRVNLDIGYFKGCGFWVGARDAAGSRGNFRETSELNIRARACGDVDGTASILFELTDSTYPADSSNLCKSINLECVFPYGKGVAFIDARTVNDGSSPIYGMSGRIMAHGWQDGPTNKGALLHFEGDISFMDFDVYIAMNRGIEADIVFERNPNTFAAPRNINLRTQHPNSLKAYHLEYGSNINLDILGAPTRKETLTVGNGFVGPIEINNNTDDHFISYQNSFTFGGTEPVNLSAWAGSFNSNAALRRFMPTVNANGTGDTVKAVISGVTGVVTRSGSTTAGNDAYTFTPDDSSSIFVGAGTFFSKIVIPTRLYSVSGGRFDQPTAPRGGVGLDSAWNASRLLRMTSFHFWIQGGATPWLRYISGPPTGDDSGRAFAVVGKTYVNNSATPTIGTRNLLVANYGSATTITNFLSGTDGQVFTLLATNSNCTVANNTNIATKTGANVVMTANTAIQFVYSADLSRWVQVG